MSALAGLAARPRSCRPSPARLLLSGPARAAAGSIRQRHPTSELVPRSRVRRSRWLLGSGLLTRTVGLTATSAWVWDAASLSPRWPSSLLPSHRARLRAVLGPVGRRARGGRRPPTALVFLPLALRHRPHLVVAARVDTVVLLRARPSGRRPGLHPGDVARVRCVDAVPERLPPVHHRYGDAARAAAGRPDDGGHHRRPDQRPAARLRHGRRSPSALGAGRLRDAARRTVAVAAGIGPLRLAAYRPEGFASGWLS